MKALQCWFLPPAPKPASTRLLKEALYLSSLWRLLLVDGNVNNLGDIALFTILRLYTTTRPGLIRSILSLRYGLSTPYRLTIRNSARLFHIVLFNMGDMHLVLPALSLSTLNAGILIMMHQVRLTMLSSSGQVRLRWVSGECQVRWTSNLNLSLTMVDVKLVLSTSQQEIVYFCVSPLGTNKVLELVWFWD